MSPTTLLTLNTSKNMNSCILMAEIIQEPQLRYTPENQMAIMEMLVQFPGSRPEEPPATLKVVIGWGNLAQEIHGTYHQGDRVIIEGRLSMNTIEHPKGFKEKRAELTAQKIYSVTGEIAQFNAATVATPTASSSTTPPSNVVTMTTRNRPSSQATGVTHSASNSPTLEDETADFDDPIPF